MVINTTIAQCAQRAKTWEKVHYSTQVHLRIMVGGSFESELSKEFVESHYSSKFFTLGVDGDLLPNMGNVAKNTYFTISSLKIMFIK